MKNNYIKPAISILEIEIANSILTMSSSVNNNPVNYTSADGKGRNDVYSDEFFSEEKGFGDLW